VSTSRLLVAGLSVLGLAISLYLTVVHFAQGQVPLLCSTGAVINCEQVTSSPESMVGPVPVAALGAVWFLVMLGISLSSSDTPFRRAAVARLAWASGGLLVVFYLIYAELFLIGAMCLWCTVVHLLVFALFLVTLADAMVPVEPIGMSEVPSVGVRSRSGESGPDYEG
jgi:uncharacterized membrane protein